MRLLARRQRVDLDLVQVHVVRRGYRRDHRRRDVLGPEQAVMTREPPPFPALDEAVDAPRPPVVGELGQRRPGRTMIERTPLPSSSILSVRATASTPALLAVYPICEGRGATVLAEVT